MNSWAYLLFCFLFRSSGINGYGENCVNSAVKSLMLNGHYIRWPSKRIGDNFVRKYQYIPKNIIYTKFQICANDVFLAAPRYKRGVPFTLGKTQLKNNREMQQSFVTSVNPFPCLDQQGTGKGSCADGALVNVVDLVMGDDGILWVLDIGISNTLDDNPSTDGDTKIVGFDVASRNIKHTISLRSLNCKAQRRYQYLLVERTKNGKTMLYVAECHTRSIIMWDVDKNVGSRIKLHYSIVQGCTENPHDDDFHIALVEHDDGNYIYFTFMSSKDVFRILTINLQNRKRIDPKHMVYIGKKLGKMVFVGVGYGSILYFRLHGQKDLFSWDTNLPLLEENMKMVRKSRDCRIITHMDVDNKGQLWILESNIQDFMSDQTGCYGPSILLTAVQDFPVPMKIGK